MSLLSSNISLNIYYASTDSEGLRFARTAYDNNNLKIFYSTFEKDAETGQ